MVYPAKWNNLGEVEVLFVVASFGALCNVVSVFIFLKQRFRKAFHQLLMLLAVYDFLVSQHFVTGAKKSVCPRNVNACFGFDVELRSKKASTDEM